MKYWFVTISLILLSGQVFASPSINLISGCSQYSDFFCTSSCENNRCPSDAVGLQEDTQKTFSVIVKNVAAEIDQVTVTVNDNCRYAQATFPSGNKSGDTRKTVSLSKGNSDYFDLTLSAVTGDETCEMELRVLDKENRLIASQKISVVVWY